MGSASNYLENKILDHIVGKSNFAMPTAYIGLWTATLDDAATGANTGEAAYNTYARKATNAADWNSAANGTIKNATVLAFPACNSGTAVVTHFALLDSGSIGAGNVLAWGTCSLSISAGITPQFAIDGLTITLD